MYLFFVRAFNDIDHITPIVWRMNKEKYPVAVYCMNPAYDIQNDYRLSFLRKQGVTVKLIYDEFDQGLGLLHRALRFLFLKSFLIRRQLDVRLQFLPAIVANIFKYLSEEIGYKLYKFTKNKYYDINWARKILEECEAHILCFDWIGPKNYVVKELRGAAKGMSIPAISLPHGVFLYTNDFIKIGGRDNRFRKFDNFDYVIVQNRLRKEVIARSGVDREKIFVLGSARYCNEWMEQNREILPRKMTSYYEDAGKLKVVFMTTRPSYRVNVEKMARTFEVLYGLEGIETVVKPHTRTGKEARLYENLPLSNVSDLSSVELCEWADVVLVIGSSILIEPLLQNKPVLYLKYLHENTTEYEEFGACWIIHDDSELQDALMSLQDGERDVPYTDQKVKKWLAEIIYGGKSERDVLKDYGDFIVSCVAGKN